jgi:hypothetical protein
MPAWLALLEIALTGFVGLTIVSVFVYAPFWLIGGFFEKRRRPAERAMRLWPLIAVFALLSCAVEVALASREIFDRLGHFSPWSVRSSLLLSSSQSRLWRAGGRRCGEQALACAGWFGFTR